MVAWCHLHRTATANATATSGAACVYQVTCQAQPALGMVYKLVEANKKARIKLSQEVTKITIPGDKEAYRLVGADGVPLVDILLRTGESKPEAGRCVISLWQVRVLSGVGGVMCPPVVWFAGVNCAATPLRKRSVCMSHPQRSSPCCSRIGGAPGWQRRVNQQACSNASRAWRS